MSPTLLRSAFLTVPEAAYLAGVSLRMVQHEIDEQIVEAPTREGRRSISGVDVLYLNAVRRYYTLMAPALRREVRQAICVSAAQNKKAASFEVFHIDLAGLEAEVLSGFECLERTKREFVESRPEVLGGEPVLRGTRISVRHVANLVKQGATSEELQDDLDLTPAQIEAAVLYDRVTPKRGRPRRVG